MKKYTQSDFDNFEVDENGYKICPSGDYTQISSFGEGCRFGEGAALARSAALARCAALKTVL